MSLPGQYKAAVVNIMVGFYCSDLIIRIKHDCEVLIEISHLFRESLFGITRLLRVILNCEPRDRIAKLCVHYLLSI